MGDVMTLKQATAPGGVFYMPPRPVEGMDGIFATAITRAQMREVLELDNDARVERLVLLSIVDAQGRRMLNEDDVAALQTPVFSRLAKAAGTL